MFVTPDSHQKHIANVTKQITGGGYSYSGFAKDFDNWMTNFGMLIQSTEVKQIVGGEWKQPSTQHGLVMRPVAGPGSVSLVSNPNADPDIDDGNAALLSCKQQVELWRTIHRDYVNLILLCIDIHTEQGKQARDAVVKGFLNDQSEETVYVAGVAGVAGRGGRAAVPEQGFCAPYASRALKRLQLFGATTNTFTIDQHKTDLMKTIRFRPAKQSVNAWQQIVMNKFTELRKHDACLPSSNCDIALLGLQT
jgi:hypothetical protein